MSDLSKQLTNSLSVLADVERQYKDMQDSQAKDDMMTIMGTGEIEVAVCALSRLTAVRLSADEYSRLINSVRVRITRPRATVITR